MPSDPAGVIAGGLPPHVSGAGRAASVRPAPGDHTSFGDLMTPGRRREAGRVVLVGVITLLYWLALLPPWLPFAAVAIGLYPLVKTGIVDSISPRESNAGATEKYVVRVPTEGKVTTTGAELGVPDGVTVETLAMPAGWKHEVKRQGERIVAITWQMDITPGEFAEFAFVAHNPRDKSQIVWTLRQRFADGTVTDWTKGPAGTRPTAVTKLAPMRAP